MNTKMSKKLLLSIVLTAILTGTLAYAVLRYTVSVNNSFQIQTTYGVSFGYKISQTEFELLTSIDWQEFNSVVTTKVSNALPSNPNGYKFCIKSTDNLAEGWVAWNVTGLPSWMTLKLFTGTACNIPWAPNTYSYHILQGQMGEMFNMVLTCNWAQATGGSYSFTVTFSESDTP